MQQLKRDCDENSTNETGLWLSWPNSVKFTVNKANRYRNRLAQPIAARALPIKVRFNQHLCILYHRFPVGTHLVFGKIEIFCFGSKCSLAGPVGVILRKPL